MLLRPENHKVYSHVIQISKNTKSLTQGTQNMGTQNMGTQNTQKVMRGEETQRNKTWQRQEVKLHATWRKSNLSK